MKNKRILITGGAGSIGSELARQLAPKNKIFILDINESGAFEITEELKQQGHWVHFRVGDVRNKETVFDVFSDFKPQIVFHAAALKHVPINELYPEEAVSTNINGTLNVIKEAKNWECLEKFVFISSDKAIQSHSVMGATKRVGEILTKNQGKRFVVVRFGNVLGSRGSLLEIWQKQISEGKPLTITDARMQRYFMTIKEACQLVVSATEMGQGGEIFVLDMGKLVSIKEFAEKIAIALGRDIPLEYVGMRAGEQLQESLMLKEEKERAIKKDNFYIIQ